MSIFEINHTFKLTDHFCDEFKNAPVNWGPLGLLTYKRTYARDLPDGSIEEWWQTVRRVVEGIYTVQLNHCKHLHLPWNPLKAQASAREMYRRMFEFKFLPAGRSLYSMGTDVIWLRGAMNLYNCAMISTEHIDYNFSDPFVWLMDLSMCGVGVSFDTAGADKVIIKQPKVSNDTFIVEDSKEGWCKIAEVILDSYIGKEDYPKEIDYSQIREKGKPLITSGGIAPGPEPLILCVKELKSLLDTYVDKKLDSVGIVDIMNIIGKAVVSGGKRRTAEMAIGTYDDEDYVNMKNPDLFPEQLSLYRWNSNNSVYAIQGMDYLKLGELVAKNGEPGFIYLDKLREFGRLKDGRGKHDMEVVGVNPCGEIGLPDHGLCVSGETRIQTKTSCPMIKDVIGQEVEVWNGESWSKTTPRITGRDRKLFRVQLSDGTYLDCTDNHKWLARGKTKRKYRETETKDLIPGDTLEKFSLGEITGVEEPNAFEYGLFIGDGYLGTYLEREGAHIPILSHYLGEENLKRLCIKEGNSIQVDSKVREGYKNKRIRIRLNNLDHKLCEQIKFGDGLPEELFSWSKNSLLEFLAGWIETDGTIQKNKGSQHYRIYGEYQNLLDALLLLRRVGINNATLSIASKKGFKTNFAIRNRDLYYITIPSCQCQVIPTRVKKITEFSTGLTTNNAHKRSQQISTLKRQRVVSIEELEGLHITYCFDEPVNHLGVFNNVLTKQCNLVETFPSRHENLEDFKKTLKYAYLYGKSVTIIPTHCERTNQVIMRQRRIGVSQSGIVEAVKKIGMSEYLTWCDQGYEYLRDLDLEYSNWLCIPRSIKMTTVKPSGTLSLLPGVTPGIHYPHSEYYIRRIRISNASPLINILEKAGYDLEESECGDNTIIASIPVKSENFIEGKEHVSIWKQLELGAKLQYYWSDNSISQTVTVRQDEYNQIASALEFYEDRLKTISFYPLKNQTFVQAPYEEISKEKYEEMSTKIKPLRFRKKQEVHDQEEKYCDSEGCLLNNVKAKKDK